MPIACARRCRRGSEEPELSASTPSPPPTTAKTADHSEARARLLARDWAATPLGPVATWPSALRTVVDLALESCLPTLIAWGPQLSCLFNHAYAVALQCGEEGWGQPFAQLWPAQASAAAAVARALAGEASDFQQAQITVQQGARSVSVYFNYCMTPLRDDAGEIVGLVCHVIPTTDQILAEQRRSFVVELADALRDLADPREIMATAAEWLGRHLHADRVGYAEADESGEFATVERDWVAGDMPSAVGRHRLRDLGEQLLALGLQGHTLRVDDASNDPRLGPSEAAAHHALGGMHASLTVPLVKGGRLAAIFAAQQRAPRHWTDEDEAIVCEVAERTWAAVERARAETAQRDTSRQLRLIVESTTGFAIITTDLDGRITLWNPGAEQLLGWSEEEMLGQSAAIFFTPEDRARGVPQQEMRHAAEYGRSEDERPHLRKDGSVFFASGLMMPLTNEAGELLGYLKIMRDCTAEHEAARALERGVAERTTELAAANRQLLGQIEERERVEATLRQMQRLEAVGQLTSGVAHDFNNLLTVIIGNVGLLERALDAPGTEPRLIQRLGYVQEAAKRGAKLTSQLLAFSRRQRLEAKTIDLNDAVINMRELMESSMRGAVRLSTDLQPDLWLARADPAQLEMVILNLAINARDASPVGGQLTIRTANVSLREPGKHPGAPGPGDYVMISMTDHGSGMTPEVLAHAFEPFFTTKEVGKGSGLGLAQVYGFATQSGGGVRIESELGKGTAVEVYLPRSQGTATAEESPHAPPARVGVEPARRSILLVDDDIRVREVTAAILAERGYTVIEAGSGGAALELLEREGARIGLMLMDYAMPGMNGSEVAREVRARRPDLPLLFITGYADFAALEQVGEEGIISKPFRDQELLIKVAAALEPAAPSGH